MAFAKLPAWDSPGEVLEEHLEAISVIGMENGGWKKQCLWLFLAQVVAKEGRL